MMGASKASEDIKSIIRATAELYRQQREIQHERVFNNEELKTGLNESSILESVDVLEQTLERKPRREYLR